MRVTPRVFNGWGGTIDIENHFLGHSMDHEVASNLQLARSRRLHFFRLEGDRRILGDVEEVIGAKVLISHLHATIDRAGVDGYIHRGFAQIGRILNNTADFGERTPDGRDPHMANRKLRR